MTRKEMCRLLQEQGGRSPEEAYMIGYVIWDAVLSHICSSKSEVLKVAGSMKIEYRPPSPRNNRAYWAIQSPFTLEWYLFTKHGQTPGFPDRHHYTSNERPTEFAD